MGQIIEAVIEKKQNINASIGTNSNLNIGFDNQKVSNNYKTLINKPQINGNTLIDDMSLEQLGIVNDKNYVHNQTTASDTWVVEHNLNKYPSVSVINSANEEVIGEVEYDNVNQITIKFAAAFKGKATLN